MEKFVWINQSSHQVLWANTTPYGPCFGLLKPGESYELENDKNIRPIGFDLDTNKFRGYILNSVRTENGAVLEMIVADVMIKKDEYNE
jgi:hypothetical protein